MSISIKSHAARRASAVAGGAFALALALAACGGGNDSPEGAVEGFLDGGAEDLVNALLEGDVDGATSAAESHLCAEDVDSVKEAAEGFAGLSEEERDQALDMAGDDVLSGVKDLSYEIGEVNEDGDTATVEVSITVNDETTEQTVDLVKEDDEWKLCQFF
ncbi:DUF4878 domain-containing protein [Glycomyces sp. NRRL B-16210]|uniref:Rv0361 family membrane protein n=1 Tax=Glycomyces sp. NRRL B-16210 TaxID=1463821 RepID=UPI0004BE9665|nr:DUF4878 domain-containing protein [Glycomyces sp. NRRL B-16210]